ncbi:DUF393 domain-containing protein [Aurantiacibacter sp. MUD11]|uniref:thiol-disulfide oxidoreductase DCC family protein n=1 Tax=Aurantiacibacter sp. MUD11 TaxID=3003265 RepID=UPI0022AA3CC5|nr:DUF393 domain-containing protein [Aurantiacibacter sp. MUD11]WAT18710.1 DUF393 domain-containing protein [Aurantiacibacter sp. MUD11]
MAEVTVWYDSTCPLCRREIAFLRRLDRGDRIAFVDAHGPEAQSCPVSTEDLLARFHASEHGNILSGAAAFAAMWRAIPLLRPLGEAARIPFVLRLLEKAYLRFLKLRPRLQKWAGDN